jgi:hypothetical protein
MRAVLRFKDNRTTKCFLGVFFLLPFSMLGSSLACPTNSYADYLSMDSCAVANFTLSDFTFDSIALNQHSTPFTASEFTASGYDHPVDPTFYFGLQLTGAPEQAAGSLVETTIDFNISSTNSADLIDGIELALSATTSGGGSATLVDYGSAEGQTFYLQTGLADSTDLVELSPTVDTVHTHAVLITDGPVDLLGLNINVTDCIDMPEPATWSLFASGTLLLGALLYRSKRAS